LPFLWALVPTIAFAAPAADVVVVWAPGQNIAPVADAARDAGAAAVDRSPTAQAHDSVAPLVKAGIDAYDALKLDDAWASLESARERADRTGAAGLTAPQLSDLFMYRALVRTQRGDPTVAWDELVTALVVDPSRTLDPARFPPRVIAEHERARASIAERPKAALFVEAPGCDVTIDGAPATDAPRIVGSHWVRARCPGKDDWGARVDLTASGTRIVAQNKSLAPLDVDAELVQARVAGQRAVIVAEVRNGVATARLIGVDGRERDRRTVGITSDLAPLGAAVRELLRPRSPSPWYQSKWAYAGGAAAIAAAIAIPLTFVFAHNTTPTGVTVRPTGPNGL
jgi:hypothetical protein